MPMKQTATSNPADDQQPETTLELSAQEFRFLAEAMPQIVWATRADGWNIYFNQRWVDYTGMTLEESYGHGWNKPFHPDDKQRAWDAWQRATQHDEPYSVECRLRRHDGVYRWWLIRGEPMRGANGEILKWFGTCTDIEDLKDDEVALWEAKDHLEDRVAERTAALLESEAQFVLLIQHLKSGVALINEQGAFAIVNQSFLRIFELAADSDIKNANDRDWSQWQVFDEQGVLLDVAEHPVRKAMLTGQPVQDQLVAMQAPGQSELKWLLVSAQPILDVHGNIRRLICTYHDFTARKQAEDQIKAALAEKDVLLREIHHRVKNNLQVIASLVSLQADDITDEHCRAEFAEVQDRVRTMALIHETLYQADNLAQVNFADYADGLLRYLWEAHRGASGKVRLNLAVAPVALPVEMVVPCGLILTELVTNALKYAFPNDCAGTVTVALEPVTATGAVCLRVQDDGIGLPAGMDCSKVSSLGLRLVQMLAGQLQGTVETGPGPGTEFRINFTLP